MRWLSLLVVLVACGGEGGGDAAIPRYSVDSGLPPSTECTPWCAIHQRDGGLYSLCARRVGDSWEECPGVRIACPDDGENWASVCGIGESFRCVGDPDPVTMMPVIVDGTCEPL